ncbi:MAG: DUF348 domain-containing protein [Anaerolineae bacterium]|nr:DUF348 domain-containing protein [Anaerolineae bacterium]
MLLLTVSCQPNPRIDQQVSVTINHDNQTSQVTLNSGATVLDALEEAGITLGALDKVNPAVMVDVAEGMIINVIRVREEFEIEEQYIEFQRQTVRNESLPEGQTLLIQPGINGARQVTYRRLFENDIEVSKTEFKVITLKEAQPEIVMVGVQTPFTSISIPGTLAYLTAGNAWIIEGATANRRPIVTTGDLDGRIFELSPDAEWLLFTRKTPDSSEENINSLWVVNVKDKQPTPISLFVNNVIHHGEWVPGTTTRSFTYSTVEPRTTAPGWQANNDFNIMSISAEGAITRRQQIIEPNSGGIYGWWGTDFTWSPDSTEIAYARPDGIGLVDFQEGATSPLLDIPPLQTRGDWAWVPNISWSEDHAIIYTTNHVAGNGITSVEASPFFDLIAIPVDTGQPIAIVEGTGMFAYPVLSPSNQGGRYQIAYLQAAYPEQSESSSYALYLADRDGSNRTKVFPIDTSAGLEPQEISWMFSETDANINGIAFIYKGNLWIYNTLANQSQQITGDETITKIDWN